jgi:hypothetical protein
MGQGSSLAAGHGPRKHTGIVTVDGPLTRTADLQRPAEAMPVTCANRVRDMRVTRARAADLAVRGDRDENQPHDLRTALKD